MSHKIKKPLRPPPIKIVPNESEVEDESEMISEETESEGPDSDFNPNSYELRQNPNAKQEKFQNNFYAYNKVNKKVINKKLAELVYIQVEDTI